jgi:hypothetical protein
MQMAHPNEFGAAPESSLTIADVTVFCRVSSRSWRPCPSSTRFRDKSGNALRPPGVLRKSIPSVATLRCHTRFLISREAWTWSHLFLPCLAHGP